MSTREAAKLIPALALAALALLTVSQAGPALMASGAGQPTAVQSQDSNFAGVVADLTECKRKDGVLSVKVRLRNTSGQDVEIPLIQNRNYDQFYVTAGGKKYFVLRDSEKTPISTVADAFGSLHVKVAKGGGYTWWAKYPAPPDGEAKVTLVTPFASPFEDVPITQ